MNSKLINFIPFIKHYLLMCNSNINTSVLLILSSKMPYSTLKKKAIKLYIQFIAKLKLLYFLPKVTNNNILENIDFFSDNSKANFLVFSQDLRLRQRLYILKENNQVISFIKVIWGNEIGNISNEISAKQILVNSLDFDYILPHNAYNKNSYAVVEYKLLPGNAELQVIKPFVLYDYMLKLNKNAGLKEMFYAADIFKTDWWQNYNDIASINNFKKYAQLVVSENEQYELMWCHGDLGSENVFVSNNRFILIDWEKSHLHAPIITDYLGIVLGNHSKSILKSKNIGKSNKSLLEFYKIHIEGAFEYQDFILGLIFYLGTNFNLAQFLIKNFNFEDTIR